jgi:acetyltransferase-like isoleucine patch superfamily enzyme
MNRLNHFLAKCVVRLVEKTKQTYEKINLYYLRGELGRLGSNAYIEFPATVMHPACMSIGNNFTARSGLKIRGYTSFAGAHYTPVIVIGDNVHLATDVTINSTHRIEIGDNTAIGAGTKLMDHMHGLPGYEDILTLVMERILTSKGGVKVKHNVMIGAGVVVMPGVEIGENCIIGANSVVTRSIPPNSIAAGIPARVIKTIVPGGPGVEASPGAGAAERAKHNGISQ